MNALIFALPAIGNVAIVIVVFWLLFAIMGVQTFRGLFYTCYYEGERVSVKIVVNLLILSPLRATESEGYLSAHRVVIKGGILVETIAKTRPDSTASSIILTPLRKV